VSDRKDSLFLLFEAKKEEQKTFSMLSLAAALTAAARGRLVGGSSSATTTNLWRAAMTTTSGPPSQAPPSASAAASAPSVSSSSSAAAASAAAAPAAAPAAKAPLMKEFQVYRYVRKKKRAFSVDGARQKERKNNETQKSNQCFAMLKAMFPSSLPLSALFFPFQQVEPRQGGQAVVSKLQGGHQQVRWRKKERKER
jgi:hypothetical protein